MIFKETKFVVSDNSGAIRVACIGIRGSTGTSVAYAGQVVRVSVKSCIPNGKVKKGECYDAVIVRTVKPKARLDGMSIRFDNNAVVLIDPKTSEPIGTRVMGPVAREVRAASSKIASLADEVL